MNKKIASREQIINKLLELEFNKSPKPVMGAMCYSMSAPPDQAEYVCPSCGEKTNYVYRLAYFVSSVLPGCRREFELLKKETGLRMTLDESVFCSWCSPDAKKLRLIFEIHFPDGHCAKSILSSPDSLRKLRGFFNGEANYITSTEGKEPLKGELKELRRLLFGKKNYKYEEQFSEYFEKTFGSRKNTEETAIVKKQRDFPLREDELEFLKSKLVSIREDNRETTSSSESVRVIWERIKNYYKEAEKALAELENGSFGVCEMCGDDIIYRHLRMLPTRRYCDNCMSIIWKKERIQREKENENVLAEQN